MRVDAASLDDSLASLFASTTCTLLVSTISDFEIILIATTIILFLPPVLVGVARRLQVLQKVGS